MPADAPPLFTCIAQDDRMLFKVVEGLYADWSNADRPAELHIFAKGGHGFGMVRRGLPVDRWIDLFEDWLGDHGFADGTAITPFPLDGGRVGDGGVAADGADGAETALSPA